MFLKISRYILFLVSLQTACFTYAQEAPYYQLPKNRNRENGVKNLPNLDNFDIKFYVNLAGGVNFIGSKLNNSSDETINTNKDFGTFWEANVGQCRNDNYYFEVGFYQYSYLLSTEFSNINNNSLPLSFINGGKINTVPLRIKKRILVIDKVARNAFLNVGFGVGYSFFQDYKKGRNGNIIIRPSRNPQNEDLKELSFSYLNSKRPINIEGILELKGKPSQRMELSLFLKYIYYPKPNFTNQFNLKYVNNTEKGAIHESKRGFLNFGVQIQYNAPAFYKYKPKVF